MAETSEYEKQRQINIEENRKVLESLGLLKPFSKLPPRNKVGVCKKRKDRPLKRKGEMLEKRKPNAPNLTEEILVENYDGNYRRRSLRVKGIKPEHGQLRDEIANEEKDPTYKEYRQKCYTKRDNTFGAISGISVGTSWLTRLECSQDGIHRPTVAGIHGSEQEGCYSLALSGGYEDDIDLGDSFTYTGEGGRDLKGTKANPKNLRTAPQSKDQALTKGNLALTKNVENGRPVRVIRGYKLAGIYAPEEGYRYDGLYKVERYWETVGLSGFKVFKFVLSRCPDQEPSPWLSTSQMEEPSPVNCGENSWESDASR